MSQHSLPLIEIEGRPYVRGQQYGDAAADLIRRSLDYYEEAFGVSSGLTWAQVRELASSWERQCTEFAPDLLEEMQGIAAGAGVELSDIVALNARGEIVYDQRHATAGTSIDSAQTEDDDAEALEGCTAFALLPPAAGDGRVYCGQNWDWRHALRDTLVVLRIVQPPKPTLIMHVEAGQIGRQGANSAGIALNANGLGGRFDDRLGVPQTLIRRRVLDSSSMSSALQVLTRVQQHIASNALLTHRDAFAIDVETTPDAHGWLYPKDGLLVHGNHYQAFVPPQLAASYRPRHVDSLYRVPIAEKGLTAARQAQRPELVRKAIHSAMSDHFGYPDAVCSHVDERLPAVLRWSTLLSSCVDLTAGEYYLSAGPPCTAEYRPVPWNLYDGPGDVT